MKITNQTLDKSFMALNELMALKLPAKGAYGVARNLSKVKAALEDLQTTHKKVMEEYAVKDDKGEVIRTDTGITFGPKQADYLKAVEELMACELDIEPHIIKIESLGTVEVSVATLLTLDWLFVE